MKVLQVNAVLGYGSTGVIVSDIHKLAVSKGIDSFVAFSNTNISDDKIVNGIRIGNIFGKKIHALLSRLNGRQAYFSSLSTRKLIKQIKKIKPDVVHLHNLHSNYINLNLLLKYLGESNTRTIITLHDCWFYTGGCFHYTSVNCDKWLKRCGECPKKKQDTPAYFCDYSSKILEDRKKYFSQIEKLTVVGVSKWISEEAKKTFLGNKKIFTVYNGVDTDFYKPTDSNFRDTYNLNNKFVILGIANKWLKPINSELLDAVSDYLKPNMVFVMIGCSKEDMNKLPKKIIGLPFIANKEIMRDIYSACDVFVNCTREESFSLVNVEAQSCGTPTITYANTGAKETVDNINSFSVETANIKEFIECIQKIYVTGKESYSSGCRSFVLKNFDKNMNYIKYIDLYKTGDLYE